MTAIALLAALVITGATVQTADGPPLEGAAILVDGGRIVAVGSVEVPPGARVIDARGMIVTPGFIESHTQLGLIEVELVGTTRDEEAEDAEPVRAAFRVADAFNPASAVIPVQRAHGITTAVALPTGGLISGQAFAFDLGADTPFQPEAAVVVNLGEREAGSRASRLEDLRAVLADARFYRKNRAAYDRNQLRALAARPRDLEALGPVLEGKVPLIVHAHRRADIRSVVALAAEEGVRVILAGGTEAWLEAPALAKAGIPVIVDPMANLPGSFDALQVRDDLAARLTGAGVEVILSTFATHRARTLRQAAGNAVRDGLAPDVALRAITATPAKVFGFSDRGRIAKGLLANLVIWSGDPFEPASQVMHVLVAGEDLPLMHRQRALFERYRQLPHP